jgi:hypothetical protein
MVKNINLVKLGAIFGVAISSFFSSAAKPAQAQSQTFSQCVLRLYMGPYSAKDAAISCLEVFKGKPATEEFTTCVEALYKGPFRKNDANSYCTQALTNAQQPAQQSPYPYSPYPYPPYPSPGGNPQAIADCMKKLMYERKPVCTRSRCFSLNTPENNANQNFGGWEWQTVRTSISESAAVQACQNAR